MKANTKRILSLVLGLLLLLAMLPTAALAEETETVKANITSSTLVGTWKSNGDPTKAYDGNTGTRWNPQSTGYESGEGIIFNLDNAYDLSQIKITVGSRYHYFDIYGSADGITYQPVVTVDASNYATYYLTNYVCTIDNLNTKNVQYLKVLITGNSAPTMNAYVNFDEIEIYGTVSTGEAEIVKTIITSGVTEGGWKEVGDISKAYDGNTGTRWNPQSTGYESGESGVFTLDKAYDLTEIQITVGSRYHYFDIYGSKNGDSYTQIASVNASNYADYYLTDYVCTIDGLDVKNIQYVKVTFTGNSAASFNAFVNFDEIEIYGTVATGEEPVEEVKATIRDNVLLGHYVAIGAPVNAYDGNIGTKWNPQTSGYKSGEGIMFTLDERFDLTKIQLTFGSRFYYFNVSVSTDGLEYTQIATVDAQSKDTYYTDGYICTIDGLDLNAVKYVKLNFTGSSDGGAFINLFEIEAYGTVTELETYAVTLPAGEGYAVVGETEIKQYENYTFDVTVSDGYRKGNSFAVLVNDAAPEVNENGSYYVHCVTENLVITVEGIEQIPAVEVQKWNLSLGDDIGVNFYVAAQNPDNAQVQLTVAGNTTTKALNELTANEEGLYEISVNLAAAQMTEAVTVALAVDGEIVSTENYSVYKYAQYVLTDVNDEFDTATKALVLEMLNYGDKAQAYFDYDADTIDAELIADAGVSEIDSANVSAMSVSGSANGITFYGASLVFESKIAVRLYYTADTMDGLTVTVGDETVTSKQKENGLYYVEIAQINPHDLDEQVTVNITDANGNTLTVSYGPMNYIVRMAEKGGDNLKALMKALYNYYLKAEAYIVK